MGQLKRFRQSQIFIALLLLFLFASQHALLCSRASAAVSMGWGAHARMMQNEQACSASDPQMMEMGCAHPCHFNTVSAAGLHPQRPLTPKQHLAFSSAPFLKGVIFSVFHPPSLS